MKRSHSPNRQPQKRRRNGACAGCKREVKEDQGLRCKSGDHIACFECITRRVERTLDPDKDPLETPCLFRQGEDYCPAIITLSKSAPSACPKCFMHNLNQFRLQVICRMCGHEYCSGCNLGTTHGTMSCRERADEITWRINRIAQLRAVKCPAPTCSNAYLKDGPGNVLKCNCGQQFSAVTGAAFADPQLYFCQLSWNRDCNSADCHARGHPLVRDSKKEHKRNTLYKQTEAENQTENELKDRKNIPLVMLAARHEPGSFWGKVAQGGGIDLVKSIASFLTCE